jgi:hypothetical protein
LGRPICRFALSQNTADVASGLRLAGVKIDNVNLERVLSSRDGQHGEPHSGLTGAQADLK